MNTKRLTVFAFAIIYSVVVYSQEKPRLVVGIVVDQMRYDYLYKYWDDLGEKGFKRLLNGGFVAHNGYYEYVPTFTGPGHASIYTGTGPAHHGIIGNEWYSRTEKRNVYCVEDSDAISIGENATSGQASPHRLVATTMVDQLELETNGQSKTIGIAIKDRASILPTGYNGDAAYWLDGSTLDFITSNAYLDSLPDWVNDFNSKNLPQIYLEQGWDLMNDPKMYNESQPDSSNYEMPFHNTDAAVFPYNLKKISETKTYGVGESAHDVLATSPQGNELVERFAETAIIAENMGQDDIPDLLALSFSSTDYAGHRFGPHSVEIQDMYLRLDSILGEFLDFLDANFGLNNVLIFLTADHGAADVPAYVKEPAGYFKGKTFEDGLRSYLAHKIGRDPIEAIINQQIYLVENDSVDYQMVDYELKRFVIRFPGVMNIISLPEWNECSALASVCNKIRNGYYPSRSGNYYVQLLPGWIDSKYLNGGTTHGSPYAYDTHVPILFYGWKIVAKNSYDDISIEDIAPTVCDLLLISLPSGCTGKAINVR